MTDIRHDPNSVPDEGDAAGVPDAASTQAQANQTEAHQAEVRQADVQNTLVASAERASLAEPAAAAPNITAAAHIEHTAPAAEPVAPERTAPAEAPAAGSSAQPLFAGFGHKPAQPLEAKRPKKVGIIAAIAVAALVGGVSGAAVTAAILSSNQGSDFSGIAAKNTLRNITVNDASSVNNITAIALKAGPSVVTISVTGANGSGTGSGIVITRDGYVLTNTHVVTLDGETADPAVQVTTSEGRLFEATVVGTDPIADLAVIKLKDASGLTPAEFADSSKLNVGELAIAIGAPLGLNNTVTNGIVSALNRSISIASSAAPKSGGDSTTPKQSSPFDFWQFDRGQGAVPGQTATAAATISLPVIQTDAAINPGNSGGALLNSNAKVIGVNVAIASAGKTTASGQAGSIGVGFAIPANLAKRIADEIIKTGKATHGLLGASVKDITSSSVSRVVGASIQDITPGGAADKAGLKPGDVVTVFNGVPVTSSTDLTAQVRFLAGGASSSLTYVRSGTPHTIDVTLGTLKL